jgi:hypothetical protein
MAAISALSGLLREYAPLRRELPASWFEIEGELSFDPDFVSMAPAAVAEIREQRIWLETKVLRQYLALFGESLGDARDVANLIALETRRLGVESIDSHPNLLGLVIRFQQLSRSAVNGRDQHRLLCSTSTGRRAARRPRLPHAESRGAAPYGQLAYEMSSLPARGRPTTSRAWSSAPWDGAAEAAPLLDLFLQVDREPESPERSAWWGVRRAQVQLATFFLARRRAPRAPDLRGH